MINFNEEEHKIEATLVIQTNDETLFDTLKHIFPNEDDIIISKQAIGGAEITAWFTISKNILMNILDFISNNKARINRGCLIINKEEIKIQNYSKDDVDALLKSPGMQNAFNFLQKNHDS